MKYYQCISVNPKMGWPSEEQIVTFRGTPIRVVPETEKNAPQIIIEVTRGDELKGLRTAYEFMSALAWMRDGGLSERFSFSSPSESMRAGGPGNTVRMIDNSVIEHLPEPTSGDARLGLALWREAHSVDWTPYKFLSLFKIINIRHAKGKAIRAWIAKQIGQPCSTECETRLSAIAERHGNVASYLYESGRCAVAHAHFGDIVVNPDEPEDWRRLNEDMPVMLWLARRMMEFELGVKTPGTVRRQHLFELAGFKSLQSAALLAEIAAKGSVSASEIECSSRMSLRVRSVPDTPAFENLEAKVLWVSDHTVCIGLKRADGRAQVVVKLAMREERFYCQLGSDLSLTQDDGSVEWARCHYDALRMTHAWVCNRIVELWQSEPSTKLCMSAPYIPVNVTINSQVMRESVEAALQVLNERKRIASRADEP